MKTIPHLDFLY